MIVDRALTDPPLRLLPVAAADLLRAHQAPPRLAAHLRAVHDVAVQIADWLAGLDFSFDREAVLFGAATHDIGKIVHVAELSGPGSRHEAEGERLLLDAGVEPRLARFAATHASWHPGIATEDLLVSLADKVWKAKRVDDLEQLVIDRLFAGAPAWQGFATLDAFLEELTAGADRRLAFQNSYPIRGE